MSARSPAFTDDVGFLEPVGVRLGHDRKIVDAYLAGLALHVGDAALETLRLVRRDERMAEARHPQQRWRASRRWR